MSETKPLTLGDLRDVIKDLPDEVIVVGQTGWDGMNETQVSAEYKVGRKVNCMYRGDYDDEWVLRDSAEEIFSSSRSKRRTSGPVVGILLIK